MRLAAAVLLLLAGTSASAIIIRHDKEDSLYRALGEQYRATVVEIALPTGSADLPTRGNGVGTLIAPNWVVTAAHVASIIKPGHSRSRVTGVHKVYLDDEPYEVEKVILHPEWIRLDSPADVALIKLKTPVSGGKIACLYPTSDEVGQVAVLVGNGFYGNGLSGPLAPDARFRGATIRIEGSKEDGQLIWWPFRAPTDPKATPLEGISGPGDSGGPAFLQYKGKLCIAGISSRQTNQASGEGHYGVHEEYPRISFFRQWIESTMRAESELSPAKPPR